MKEVLKIEARREGYSFDQVERTMTVGELIEVLQNYDEDTPIYLSHDYGYTYGGIWIYVPLDRRSVAAETLQRSL